MLFDIPPQCAESTFHALKAHFTKAKLSIHVRRTINDKNVSIHGAEREFTAKPIHAGSTKRRSFAKTRILDEEQGKKTPQGKTNEIHRRWMKSLRDEIALR